MLRFSIAAVLAIVAPGAALAQSDFDELTAAWIAALEAEDVAAMTALYTENAVSFAPDGTSTTGAEAIAANWIPFFDAFSEIKVTVSLEGVVRNARKSALGYGLWRIDAKDPSGGPMSMGGRFTDYAISTNRGWRYVHDHASSAAVEAHSND